MSTSVPELDGRTRQGRLYRQAREDLLREIGNDASMSKRILAEQAATLRAQMEAIEERLRASVDPEDNPEYAAMRDVYLIMLGKLGVPGSVMVAGRAAAA